MLHQNYSSWETKLKELGHICVKFGFFGRKMKGLKLHCTKVEKLINVAYLIRA